MMESVEETGSTTKAVENPVPVPGVEKVEGESEEAKEVTNISSKSIESENENGPTTPTSSQMKEEEESHNAPAELKIDEPLQQQQSNISDPSQSSVAVCPRVLVVKSIGIQCHNENNPSSSSALCTIMETPLTTPPPSPPVKTNWWKRFIQNRVEGMTRRQVMICIIFAFVEFFAATVISIQAPFFPEVAESKGATSVEYGFVFGIFELTVFIMSPFFGAKMNTIGPKKLFNYGIFTTGACCVLFGFLNFLEGRASFIISCFVVRTVEAIGDAAFVVASFTIIALEFPDSVATTFGTMETFYGLGMIVGPTLGGALYEAGGYTLPFALMGTLLFVCAWATYFFLPEIGETPSLEKGDKKELLTTSGFETFKLLRFPVIFMIAYSIVATASGVGFLHSTLEPHLDTAHADLNKILVGAVFILNGGVYAITAPTWGRICDQSAEPKWFTVIGTAFTISGFLFIGPLPIFPWDTSLWSICIGLVLFGLGLGATLVSAFIQALQDAIALGYPDDVSTYGLVSGLWTSMTALGFFIGASSGGILTHYVKFRWGTVFILFEQLVLVVMLLTYFLTLRKKSGDNQIDDLDKEKEVGMTPALTATTTLAASDSNMMLNICNANANSNPDSITNGDSPIIK